MIIYRDCISQDEMFSDIYKIREVADGLCLEVEGKMVTRTEGQIDDSLIGGNASAEGPEGDGTEATVITGVDIVINHHLQETSFTKESYKKYIKDYMKAIKARLEEHKPERVKPFMTGAAEQIKHILANFKNYQERCFRPLTILMAHLAWSSRSTSFLCWDPSSRAGCRTPGLSPESCCQSVLETSLLLLLGVALT
ncbi:PREDICTED: translationally-controlled tumor protein isoform X1 [Pseudopodoces humilis]|uniref:translationally-controlled tumor protein isoform X1 n=1 Tax=Pseudopodoces humilis TaxID=181119 RepID=UPI0006B6B3A7|nr:PREDICTED: translationally-controlled tumor protein isoform X1 [Pseudopodoces humilis]